MVAGLKVWIYRDTCLESFKVAIGETPAPFGECKWLTREEAEHFVMANVMEVSDVE